MCWNLNLIIWEKSNIILSHYATVTWQLLDNSDVSFHSLVNYFAVHRVSLQEILYLLKLLLALLWFLTDSLSLLIYGLITNLNCYELNTEPLPTSLILTP